jgi:hypothetical protein
VTSASSIPLSGPNWWMLVLDCPRCKKPLVFCRGGSPKLDSCGFESHRLDCPECDGKLAAIVDPLDDALIVSLLDDVAD